jgi:hypothetical protein
MDEAVPAGQLGCRHALTCAYHWLGRDRLRKPCLDACLDHPAKHPRDNGDGMFGRCLRGLASATLIGLLQVGGVVDKWALGIVKRSDSCRSKMEKTWWGVPCSPLAVRVSCERNFSRTEAQPRTIWRVA